MSIVFTVSWRLTSDRLIFEVTRFGNEISSMQLKVMVSKEIELFYIDVHVHILRYLSQIKFEICSQQHTPPNSICISTATDAGTLKGSCAPYSNITPQYLTNYSFVVNTTYEISSVINDNNYTGRIWLNTNKPAITFNFSELVI